MTTRQTRMQWVYVLVWLVACPAWAQEGQPELDKAMDLKISADSLKKGPGDMPKPIEVVFKLVNGKVHQIPVKTGISSEVNIEILSGIAEGDSIVSGPFRTLSQKLKDGETVRVKPKMGTERPQGQGQENR